jgi:hypothetical protein
MRTVAAIALLRSCVCPACKLVFVHPLMLSALDIYYSGGGLSWPENDAGQVG